MAKIDSVCVGLEDDFVQANDFAFAEGCDFQIFIFAAGLADYLLERDCGAGGSVFFLRVVALENLAGVIVLQRSGGGAGHFEEKIYADGEIGGVKESCLGAARRDRGLGRFRGTSR